MSLTAQMDATRRWDDVLRAYAAVLDDYRSFLGVVGPSGLGAHAALPPAFEVPLDMPPCPPSLVGRAEALRRETAGLVQLAEELLRKHPPVTMSRRTAHGAGTIMSSIMDTRL